jgi:hypothetical protein
VIGLVSIEESLDPILPWRDLRDALQGIAEHSSVDERVLTGPELVRVHAEDQLGLRTVADLKPGFRGVVVGDEKKDSAVLRFTGSFLRKGDGELEGGAVPNLPGGLATQPKGSRSDDHRG